MFTEHYISNNPRVTPHVHIGGANRSLLGLCCKGEAGCTYPWTQVLLTLTRGARWLEAARHGYARKIELGAENVMSAASDRDLLSLSAKTRLSQTQISTNRPPYNRL
jgi:hypothetical protein